MFFFSFSFQNHEHKSRSVRSGYNFNKHTQLTYSCDLVFFPRTRDMLSKDIVLECYTVTRSEVEHPYCEFVEATVSSHILHLVRGCFHPCSSLCLLSLSIAFGLRETPERFFCSFNCSKARLCSSASVPAYCLVLSRWRAVSY